MKVRQGRTHVRLRRNNVTPSSLRKRVCRSYVDGVDAIRDVYHMTILHFYVCMQVYEVEREQTQRVRTGRAHPSLLIAHTRPTATSNQDSEHLSAPLMLPRRLRDAQSFRKISSSFGSCAVKPGRWVGGNKSVTTDFRIRLHLKLF